MKLYLTTAVIVILLSSCLKQSIPDAMLAAKNGPNVTATLSYEVNGNPVNISVNDANNQDLNGYTLGCSKTPGEYSFDAVGSTGEFTFVFATDSLTTKNYIYTGYFGETFFLSYNGQDEYVHVPSDSMSFNITSYKNGHISGNFSGVLTPLIDASTISNIYGTPSSIFITNGSFKNVPIFY